MLFGISQHSLPARVAFTNTFYGGDKPYTHRVLYVNGESGLGDTTRNEGRVDEGDRFLCVAGGVDPWKELSVVQGGTEDGEEVQSIFIQDSAHCADMMSPRATDRPSLRKARQVREYISDIHTVKMTVAHKVLTSVLPPLRRLRNVLPAG